MPRALTFLLTSFLFCWRIVQAQPELTVVYPREGDQLSSGRWAFVYGHVRPEQAAVTVNGIRARKYTGGRFLARIPVRPGEMRFLCKAEYSGRSSTVIRRVVIPTTVATWPVERLGIDTTLVFPDGPLQVRAGDRILFYFKGTPGMKASFAIPGVTDFIPMQEYRPHLRRKLKDHVFINNEPPQFPSVKGIYTGSFTFTGDKGFRNARVQFRLTNNEGKSVRFMPSGTIRYTARQPAIPAVIEQPYSQAKLPPQKATQVFFPVGARVRIIGRQGMYLRIELSQQEDFWLPESIVSITDAFVEKKASHLKQIEAAPLPDRLQLRFVGIGRLPYSIRQTSRPQQLILTLYGNVMPANGFRPDIDIRDPLIRDIQITQPTPQTLEFSIRLQAKNQWGYKAYFDTTGLVLHIRRPPEMDPTASNVFKNLLICIDPGHGPDTGALGPSGVSEQVLALQYARTLKAMLLKRQARVYLTRDSSQVANLASRRAIAESVNAHLFISLHFNSIPDGANPFKIRGASTYYFQPQSRLLARLVQKYLLKRTKLPNFGVYQENLAVCRNTWMPAILVEPAFIMHPIEEEKLLDEAFRQKVATAILEGVEAFLRQSLIKP